MNFRGVNSLAAVVAVLLAVGIVWRGVDTAAAQPQIGANSCQGEDACTGLTGTSAITRATGSGRASITAETWATALATATWLALPTAVR